MTLTSLITLNAVLAAIVVYGLHLLLAYGIASDRRERHELAALPAQEPERLAA